MSGADELIHRRIVELAQMQPGGVVVDLGCGSGPTLAAFARSDPKCAVHGFDRSSDAVAKAIELLASHPGASEFSVVDLRDPVPLPDGCADAVVSYNLLECLPDPLALINEVGRLLAPGGTAVLAHVDFDSLVVAGAPQDLDRRICHASADDQQPCMDCVDGRLGRQLPGLVRRSTLCLRSAEPLVTSQTDLDGHAGRRIGGIRGTLVSAAVKGRGAVPRDDVDRWHESLVQAASLGQFFFAETAILVTAQHP
jgi:SAM-dependent methyltransferase